MFSGNFLGFRKTAPLGAQKKLKESAFAAAADTGAAGMQKSVSQRENVGAKWQPKGNNFEGDDEYPPDILAALRTSRAEFGIDNIGNMIGGNPFDVTDEDDDALIMRKAASSTPIMNFDSNVTASELSDYKKLLKPQAKSDAYVYYKSNKPVDEESVFDSKFMNESPRVSGIFSQRYDEDAILQKQTQAEIETLLQQPSKHGFAQVSSRSVKSKQSELTCPQWEQQFLQNETPILKASQSNTFSSSNNNNNEMPEINFIMFIGLMAGLLISKALYYLKIYLTWFQLLILKLRCVIFGSASFLDFCDFDDNLSYSTHTKIFLLPLLCVCTIIFKSLSAIVFIMNILLSPAPELLVGFVQKFYF